MLHPLILDEASLWLTCHLRIRGCCSGTGVPAAERARLRRAASGPAGPAWLAAPGSVNQLPDVRISRVIYITTSAELVLLASRAEPRAVERGSRRGRFGAAADCAWRRLLPLACFPTSTDVCHIAGRRGCQVGAMGGQPTQTPPLLLPCLVLLCSQGVRGCPMPTTHRPLNTGPGAGHQPPLPGYRRCRSRLCPPPRPPPQCRSLLLLGSKHLPGPGACAHSQRHQPPGRLALRSGPLQALRAGRQRVRRMLADLRPERWRVPS